MIFLKILEKLVRRLRNGLTSNKYKQVDYEKLKAAAAAKRFAGNEKLLKVKKLQEVSKQVCVIIILLIFYKV